MQLRTALMGVILVIAWALAPVPAAHAADDPDVVLWQSIDPNNAGEIQAYLDTYPQGKFVNLAKVRLKELQAPPPAPVPAAISGPTQVLDTANLMVGGKVVALFGVVGLGAPYDSQLGSYIQNQGGTVTCQPRDNGKAVCVTVSGFDLAKAALRNGGARAAADAPPDYLAQQDQAKANHAGIWQSAASPNQPQQGRHKHSSPPASGDAPPSGTY